MIRYIHYSPEKNQARSLDPGHIQEMVWASAGILWVDLERPVEKDVTTILNETFRFHHLTIGDCQADLHFPKLDVFDDYLFLVLHAVDYDEDQERFATSELDVYLGKNFLVTFHKRPRRAVTETFRKCQDDPGIISPGPDFLLYHILLYLMDRYRLELEKREYQLNELRKQLLQKESGVKVLNRIELLRQDLTKMKRISSVQRDLMGRLSSEDFPMIHHDHKVYFRDLYDDLLRIAETADLYLEEISHLYQIQTVVHLFQSKRSMSLLAQVAVWLLPLLVITGFFGMRVAGVPGGEWRGMFYVLLVGTLGIAGGFSWWWNRKVKGE